MSRKILKVSFFCKMSNNRTIGSFGRKTGCTVYDHSDCAGREASPSWIHLRASPLSHCIFSYKHSYTGASATTLREGSGQPQVEAKLYTFAGTKVLLFLLLLLQANRQLGEFLHVYRRKPLNFFARAFGARDYIFNVTCESSQRSRFRSKCNLWRGDYDLAPSVRSLDVFSCVSNENRISFHDLTSHQSA